MIKLKTLLSETRIKPLKGALRGGLPKIAAYFKQLGDVTVNAESAQQRYGYTESNILSQVDGRTYMNLESQNAATKQSLISISRITDSQSDLPTFKRVSYVIIYKGSDAKEYTYFMCEFNKDSMSDSIGQWQQGRTIISSVNTIETSGSTLTMPADFVESVKQSFPSDWNAIREDLITITGLTIK